MEKKNSILLLSIQQDAKGKIYVADTGNNRIQTFQINPSDPENIEVKIFTNESIGQINT